MEALKAMKNVLQKTYFKNVLKDGFIVPFIRHSITISVSAFWYVVIGLGAWSCNTYNILAVPLLKEVFKTNFNDYIFCHKCLLLNLAS